MAKEYNTVEDLEGVSGEEFWGDIANKFEKSAEEGLSYVEKVINYLRAGNEKALNDIVNKYFQINKENFGNKEDFIVFLIQKLEEYISFARYLGNNRLSGPKDEERYKQTSDFELNYNEILYYGRTNRFEKREQHKEQRKLEEKAPFMEKARRAITSILGK